MEDKILKLQNRIELMQVDLNALWSAVDLLASNCGCSVKERMSGHLVDCVVPHVKDILDGTDHAEEQQT